MWHCTKHDNWVRRNWSCISCQNEIQAAGRKKEKEEREAKEATKDKENGKSEKRERESSKKGMKTPLKSKTRAALAVQENNVRVR